MDATTQTDLNEMVENFALFDDWEQRYRYLIDLGRTLPAMDEALKSDANLVRGCTSRVWMSAQVKDGHFYFIADHTGFSDGSGSVCGWQVYAGSIVQCS